MSTKEEMAKGQALEVLNRVTDIINAVSAIGAFRDERARIIARARITAIHSDLYRVRDGLRDLANAIEHQSRLETSPLPEVLANVGEELREQGAEVNAERFEAALRESREDEP